MEQESGWIEELNGWVVRVGWSGCVSEWGLCKTCMGGCRVGCLSSVGWAGLQEYGERAGHVGWLVRAATYSQPGCLSKRGITIALIRAIWEGAAGLAAKAGSSCIAVPADSGNSK